MVLRWAMPERHALPHTSFNHPERCEADFEVASHRENHPSLRNSSQLPDINRWRPNDGCARLYSVRSQHCHADQTALHAKHLHLCWAMRCAPEQQLVPEKLAMQAVNQDVGCRCHEKHGQGSSCLAFLVHRTHVYAVHCRRRHDWL